MSTTDDGKDKNKAQSHRSGETRPIQRAFHRTGNHDRGNSREAWPTPPRTERNTPGNRRQLWHVVASR